MLLDDANLLSVTYENYNEADIKKAFRLAAMKAHPDMAGGTTEWFMAVQLARNNLLDALKDNITAEQIWSGIYDFTPKSSSYIKDNLDGITSLDLCLLISHISMLYYGDTLELMARNGRTFRYSPRNFRSGTVVPFLKDFAAWNCGLQNGLIDIFQPFEYSPNPKIVLSIPVSGLEIGLHKFVLMFGGRAFPYEFYKSEITQSYINIDFEFSLSHTYDTGGKRKDIHLTISVDLFF
ncbi:MAG: J domain-containing protein [Oscillospiraceae bacterium]|nr:J domain-containing protein [Oscillospiraceae bacterium]